MVAPSLTYSPRSDPAAAVEAWVERPALRQMIEAFGFEWPAGDLSSRLEQLVDLSAVWDRRSGRSRLEIDDAGLDVELKSRLVGWAGELGLVDGAPPSAAHHDIVLVLGGLVTGCVSRVKHLADLIGRGEVRVPRIALLGSFRELKEAELALAGEVAPGARTEVEVLMAMADSLQPGGGRWHSEQRGDPLADPARAELVAGRGEDPQVVAFAAASGAPAERPANTADTYRQVATHLRFTAGTRVLIVTTHIYATYQHWDAVRILGLPYGVELETVGTPPAVSRRAFTPAWYAQEIRSTLRSGRDLVKARTLT